MKKLLSIGLLTVLMALNVFALSGCSRTTSDNTSNTPVADQTKTKNWEDLAKALTASGAKMYGASWCSHCQEQKAAFGNAVKYITYVECSDPKNPYRRAKACETAQIESYPTWIFSDGSREIGFLTYEQLAQKVGFTSD